MPEVSASLPTYDYGAGSTSYTYDPRAIPAPQQPVYTSSSTWPGATQPATISPCRTYMPQLTIPEASGSQQRFESPYSASAPVTRTDSPYAPTSRRTSAPDAYGYPYSASSDRYTTSPYARSPTALPTTTAYMSPAQYDQSRYQIPSPNYPTGTAPLSPTSEALYGWTRSTDPDNDDSTAAFDDPSSHDHY